MSEEQWDVSGTLFRGADGNLYFIPDSQLAPFHVFDREQPRIEGLLTGEAVDPRLVPDPEAAIDLQAVYTTVTLSKDTSPGSLGRAIVHSLLKVE